MSKKKLRSYTPQYRVDAVLLAREIGSTAAAKQLNIPVETLYTWLSRAKQGDLPLSPIDPDPKESLKLAERVRQLERENAMLRSERNQMLREKKILEDAAVFFASRQKK